MKRWRPKRLYTYIIKTFIPLLLAGFSVSLFVVVIQFLWQSVGTLVGKGVDGLVLLRLLFFASMTMVPLALVLGVLVASLMTFGNLGERMELLAMKAAGIPLYKILKPAFYFVVVLAMGLFVFQNDWMIQSQVKFWQYYFSIKNKSPELAIPEGAFYKGVDNYSIFVEKKDNKRKMLYGLMLYDFTQGFDESMVVVADSGRLYSTPKGMELILELYHGESFQNLRGQDGYTQSSEDRPFLRERFGYKELHIPFNTDLSMVDESILTSQFVGKDMWQLKAYTDSLRVEIDSLALLGVQNSTRRLGYQMVGQSEERESLRESLHEESMEQVRRAVERTSSESGDAEGRYSEVGDAVEHYSEGTYSEESVGGVTTEKVTATTPKKARKSKVAYASFDVGEKLSAVGASTASNVYASAIAQVTSVQNDTFFTVEEMREDVDLLRKNESEYWRKLTYPVACIAFFLIGAPLGALIRKGGMGLPFLVAVFLFIFFYILETFGIKMAREGTLLTWVGMWLPNMVLVPVGVLLCVVASRDTNRWNVDFLTQLRSLWGPRTKRTVEYKEVTMESVDYELAREQVLALDQLAKEQLEAGKLGYGQFFREEAYFTQRRELYWQVEQLVEHLKHSRDYSLVDHLEGYPYLKYLIREWRTTKWRVNELLMWLFPVGGLCYLLYILRNKRYLRGVKAIRQYNKVLLVDIERAKLNN